MAGVTTWTEEQDNRLRALWDEGHSTAQIGYRMGKTKNAIVGRAHRMGLVSRPSPIINAGGPRAPRPLARATRERAVRLPALASIAAVVAPRVEGRARQEAQHARVSVVAQPLQVEEAPRVVFKPRKPTACCWPTGEGKGIRFECEAVARPGKPYCGFHHAQAYTTRPEAHVDLAPWLPNRQGVTGPSGVGFV
jgi:GcrA cell cycle regulator